MGASIGNCGVVSVLLIQPKSVGYGSERLPRTLLQYMLGCCPRVRLGQW